MFWFINVLLQSHLDKDDIKMQEFKSKLAVFDNNVYQYHLAVPDFVNHYFAQFEHKRVIFSINGQLSKSGGIMKAANYFYLLLNKEIVTQLNLHVGQEISVRFERDTSEYGMEMPEELKCVLDQDHKALAYFQKLIPGKQRNLIYLVSKIKHTDKRINKAFAIVEHLLGEEGKLDFKKLNETIKKFNNLDKR